MAMDDLGGRLPPGRYPLLDRLSTAGIRGLYSFAAEDFGYRPQRSGYLNHCDLCTEIRSFLLLRENETFLELAPEGFYAERIRDPNCRSTATSHLQA